MRLRVSPAAANEELIALVNKGYGLLDEMTDDYTKRKSAGVFDDQKVDDVYGAGINIWANDVVAALQRVFPTQLEAHAFANPEMPFGAVSGDYNCQSLRRRFTYFVKGLARIRRESLPGYTDLPLKERLFVEDIDSFRKVRDINPA